MSLRIEVKSPLVQEISGVSKAGKPYNIRKQTLWAYTYDQQGNPNPYPERIETSLADGQVPFEVGQYTLSDRCFFVGDFNSLDIGRLVLDKVINAVRPAA